MSGPKDYVVVLFAERMLADLARREAANASRRRATEERMRRNRERAQHKAAELARKRAEAAQRAQARIEAERQRQAEAQKRLEVIAEARKRNDARGDAKRAHIRDASDQLANARARDDLARRKREASSLQGENVQTRQGLAEAIAAPETSSVPAPATDQSQAAEPAALLEDTSTVDMAASADENLLQQKLSELAAWRDELAADEAIQQFHRTAADAWTRTADSFLAEDPQTGSFEDALGSVENACREAQRLHDEAGTRQADFTARNELLRDVMDSLKEIGFFVGDPAYADPSDPAGPVLVKATRGPEVMTASIDLSQMVHSVWDGLEDEHCKASFFEYVERMKTRGVEVQAERADLRHPPMLKRQGAKDLPRGQQIGGGA